MSNGKPLGRREFLRWSMLATGAVALSACAPQSTSNPSTPVPATPPSGSTPPTTAPLAPTKAVATSAAIPTKLDFPAQGKAINVIVPWPAGGTADSSTRILGASLEKQVGVPVQVVNKGGAGSQLGLTDLVLSKPDGYTLVQMPTPTFMMIYLDSEMKAVFTRKDFQPISTQMEVPGAISVRKDSPYETLKDLVADAKARPNQVTAAITGALGMTRIMQLLLERESGAKFAQVTFDGGAPVLTALLGGHVDCAYGIEADFISQVKSGDLRLLGVMSKQDSKFLPEVKTFESQGYKLYMGTTREIAAPAGTPKEIVNYLNGAIKRAMEDPATLKKMEEAGLQASAYMTPEQIDAFWADMETQVKELMALAKQQQ